MIDPNISPIFGLVLSFFHFFKSLLRYLGLRKAKTAEKEEKKVESQEQEIQKDVDAAQDNGPKDKEQFLERLKDHSA